MVTLVPTVIPISNDIYYFRGGTLYIYIEMSTMAFSTLSRTQNFVQDIGIFISLSWKLINTLCSLKTMGFYPVIV